MLPSPLRNIRPVVAWTGVMLAGLAAGWYGRGVAQDRVLAGLVDDAERSAVAFDPAEVRVLTGTSADIDQPEYAAVHSRLRSLRAINSRVRAVYLLRQAGGASPVVYLADSAAPGSRVEATPGDRFAGGLSAPGLQELLRTGHAGTEGPLRNRYGKWLTAFAAVDERPGARAGEVTHDVLGIDVDAQSWARELWLSALQSAIYVWLLLGLPVGAWRLMRRQIEQRDVIRNLSEAMEQSHSALMICDVENRIEYANRGLCVQTGYARRELIGRNWRDFRVVDGPELILSELLATVRAGRPWEGEWMNRRKDGTIYPVRGVVTPVKHRDGSLACFVAVFDDVTEIKRRETELREARDLAQAGDRAKSQFLATMSHEVRTPLNGIVGFTSLLLDTRLAPEQREYVQTIRASGEALIQLTSDILDFARIESGKLKLDVAPCDPRECIEDALDLLATKAAEKNIELLHTVAPNVPATVMTDGGRLRQVLSNLIGNAVKFTERGEVTVHVQVLALTAAAEAPDSRDAGADSPPRTCVLEFTVRDTGIGIAAAQRDQLFKPFTQLDESTTRRYGGTGLGLAICRNLVRLMEGEIFCADEARSGATFTFTIRAQVATAEPPDHDLAAVRIGLVGQPGILRESLVQLIGKWGAAIEVADAPFDFAGRMCDIALVDVTDALAQQLSRQASPLPGLPAATTFGLVPISLPSDLRHALRVHFRLLINKPVHHETLFSTLSGASPRGANPEGATAVQFGLRVLVVEDNAINQRLLRRVLTNLACGFTVVENGRRALDELAHRAEEYDVVLLDLHMPEMDGIAALREIRAGKAGPHAESLWIIAVTADAREEQRARARAAGVNDYLTKPLQVAELAAAFQRFRTERLAPKT